MRITTRRSALMRVQTMRKIDYCVGIPLCFLASLVQRVLNLFQRTQQRYPKNVLFSELSEMGAPFWRTSHAKAQKGYRSRVLLVIFWPVHSHVFVLWDDPESVTFHCLGQQRIRRTVLHLEAQRIRTLSITYTAPQTHRPTLLAGAFDGRADNDAPASGTDRPRARGSGLLRTALAPPASAVGDKPRSR